MPAPFSPGEVSVPIAVCVGVVVGFATCCVLGQLTTRKNIYKDFAPDPFLEQETSYYRRLATRGRGSRTMPPTSHKTLVVLGGNSVFNGSGQKRNELWSRALQEDLGDRYHVVNFSGRAPVRWTTAAVIFECLAREYPTAIFVTNTEPGYYPAANRSAYAYLFWMPTAKGLLSHDARRTARLEREKSELGRYGFQVEPRAEQRLLFQ